MERNELNYEALNQRRQDLIHLDSQRRRLHEGIGRAGAQVRPNSWENILRIGRVKAKVASSVERINEGTQAVEERVETERRRLVAKAGSYDSELIAKQREIAVLAGFVHDGHSPYSKYAIKFDDFRTFKNDPEIPVGKKLLKEQDQRVRKGRAEEPIWANSNRERTKDDLVYINEPLRAIAIGGKEIRFEEGAEWEVVRLLANANQANRFNPEGQYVSSRDINELVIRPNGGKISASALIENVRNRSEVVSGPDDFVLAEQSYPLKGTIETRVKGRWTAHRLNGRAIQFNGPEKVLIPKGVSLDPAGRPKVVSFRNPLQNAEQPRRTVLRDRDADYDEHVKKAVEAVSVLRLPRDGNIKPVQAANALDVTLSYIRKLIQTGYLSPGYANDSHPGLTRDDLMAIEFAKMYKQGLDKNDRREVSRSFAEEIIKRQLNSEQSTK